MSPRSVATAVLLAATVLSSSSVAAQRQQERQLFTWAGNVAADRWIRIKNLNGPITVGASTTNRVEITATARWRRGDPDVVRFDVQKFGPGSENVLVCALWGERSTCSETGYETRSDPRTRNNDVSVDFRVLVPSGVKIGLTSVNGELRIAEATSDVDAYTVNGEINLAAGSGRVRAETSNGSIVARLSRVTGTEPLTFLTINGSIAVELPGDIGADVELDTVNGSLKSDFPISLTGRIDPRHLRAHIGRPGGPRVTLRTVNGSLELRQR
jgi:hypothetical protein